MVEQRRHARCAGGLPRRGRGLGLLASVALVLGSQLSRSSLSFASTPGRVALKALNGRSARVARASRGGDDGAPISFDQLEVGQKYKGWVKSVRDFGAFVDIGAEKDALLHISKVAEERITNIYDHVEEGQQLDVWISGLSGDGKIGLTAVEGRTDRGARKPENLEPFVGISPSEWHKGVVARLAPFGAFVTVSLEDGPSAQGLVHVSQIRDGFVDNVHDELEEGQEVQVRIQRVEVENGKMSLSMKEDGGSQAPADFSAFEGIESDQWLTGKVARLASFGAFVTVTAPDSDATADGLVHITQITDGYVESVEDELEVGAEVQVRVLSVDTDAGKMSLSMTEEGGAEEEGEGEEE